MPSSVVFVLVVVSFANAVALDGAALALTGGAPKILFGEMDAPVCELALDRENTRLNSTCDISTAEIAELKAKVEQLETWKTTMEAQMEHVMKTIAWITPPPSLPPSLPPILPPQWTFLGSQGEFCANPTGDSSLSFLWEVSTLQQCQEACYSEPSCICIHYCDSGSGSRSGSCYGKPSVGPRINAGCAATVNYAWLSAPSSPPQPTTD